MMLNGDKLHEAREECRNLFGRINKDKLHLGYILNELEEVYKDYRLKDDFGSFNHFLAEFGKSRKQVDELMSAAKYVKRHQIDELPVFYQIPTSKLYLLHRAGVKWKPSMYEEVLELSYTDLKKKYLITK